MNDEVPVASVRPRRHVSPIWLVPIAAAGVVAVLAYQGLSKHGPTVTVLLSQGDGLAARQSELRYRGVAVGQVEDVRLTDDASAVAVRVRVEKPAERLFTDHARFWVVRPRLERSLSDVLGGLETVVSGVYMEMDPGAPGGKPGREFRGLDDPPKLRSDEAGRSFVVTADRIGWLAPGAPVYFRDVDVGKILDDDIHGGQGPATLRVFVRAPFDRNVHAQTQFWRESGISIATGPQGLHLAMQSIEAAFTGAIAFDAPPGAPSEAESEDGATFPLYDDRATARAAFPGPRVHCATYLDGSVQGLARGSPVRTLGLSLGVVTEVRAVPAPSGHGWRARVAFDLETGGDPVDRDAAFVALLVAPAVADGHARAVLESSSFVTGEKMLAIDYAGDIGPADSAREGEVVVLPGESGDIEGITVSLGRVASKLQRLPLDDIGKNLDSAVRSVNAIVSSPDAASAVRSLSQALAGAQRLVHDLDEGLQPALQRLPEISDQLQQAAQGANATFAAYGQDSPFERGTERLMRQVSEAARSIRILAQFLDRHPEALLQGRPDPRKSR